jgi:hypothetical protein
MMRANFLPHDRHRRHQRKIFSFADHFLFLVLILVLDLIAREASAYRPGVSSTPVDGVRQH